MYEEALETNLVQPSCINAAPLYQAKSFTPPN